MADKWPDSYKERRFWRERRTLAVGSAIEDFLRSFDAKGALRYVNLWDSWAEVVGEEVASMARPLGRRGRSLVLESEDPMVAQHLTFLAPEILGAVNRFLGEPLFDDVRFELAGGRVPLGRKKPPPPPPLPGPVRPAKLGGRARSLVKDSPVDRAYAAYLRMFEELEDETPRKD
jgi:hypothetical protein